MLQQEGEEPKLQEGGGDEKGHDAQRAQDDVGGLGSAKEPEEPVRKIRDDPHVEDIAGGETTQREGPLERFENGAAH